MVAAPSDQALPMDKMSTHLYRLFLRHIISYEFGKQTRKMLSLNKNG
jgi:hypothetical protein